MSRDLEAENKQLSAIIKSLHTHTALQNTAGVVLEMKIESALRTIHVLLKEGPNIEPHNLSEMLLKIQTQLVDASEVAGSVSSPWRLDEI